MGRLLLIVYLHHCCNQTQRKHEIFTIRNGEVQGGITSPLYFSSALDLVLRLHDERVDKGMAFGRRFYICQATLWCVLIDYGDDLDITRARLTAIAEGSRVGANMVINISKTKVMYVRVH